MMIYPAIDIKGGKCVRLLQGRFNKTTVYSENPVHKALEWEALGAGYLHVVDLDGARTGRTVNMDIIGEIAEKAGIPVQAGGGIRTEEAIRLALDKGVKRVILGTSAINEPELVKKVVDEYGERIIIGIDARDKIAALWGWAKMSSFNALELAKGMETLGVKTIIYTDIARDGTLAGPDFQAMEEMVNAVNIEVIASGGIGSIQDIRDLKETGVAGVIVGKALYAGNFSLGEAIGAGKQEM